MVDGAEREQPVDYARKQDFQWISMIRLPEFVTADAFEHARGLFANKHPIHLGWRTRAKQYIRAFDILAMPSLSEGFQLSAA